MIDFHLARIEAVNPTFNAITVVLAEQTRAAALAARLTPLGLGNDIGGSLRTPAFCNGIVGMRPTMHRVPRAKSIAPLEGPLNSQLMSTDGPMARTVADVGLGLALLNGADPRDPLSVEVDLDRAPLPKRVAGVVTTALDVPLTHQVETGVRLGAAALGQAGWEIRGANRCRRRITRRCPDSRRPMEQYVLHRSRNRYRNSDRWFGAPIGNFVGSGLGPVRQWQ